MLSSSSSSSSDELRNVDDDDNIINGRDELKGGLMEVQVRGPLGSLRESECVGLRERSERENQRTESRYLSLTAANA